MKKQKITKIIRFSLSILVLASMVVYFGQESNRVKAAVTPVRMTTADGRLSAGTNDVNIIYNTPNLIIQSGFAQGMGGSTPTEINFNYPFPDSATKPIVVAAGNYAGTEGNTLGVNNITNKSFKYSSPHIFGSCGTPPGGEYSDFCGVYWIAIYSDSYDKFLINDKMKAGFVKIDPGIGTNVNIEVPFNGSFSQAPNVILSKNWINADSGDLAVVEKTKDNFQYVRSGDNTVCSNIPNGGEECGVFWVAINGNVGNSIKSGFHPDPGPDTGRVGFNPTFTNIPAVVVTSNWLSEFYHYAHSSLHTLIDIRTVDNSRFTYRDTSGQNRMCTDYGVPYDCGAYWLAVDTGSLGINFYEQDGTLLSVEAITEPITFTYPNEGFHIRLNLPDLNWLTDSHPTMIRVDDLKMYFSDNHSFIDTNKTGNINVTLNIPSVLCGTIPGINSRLIYSANNASKQSLLVGSAGILGFKVYCPSGVTVRVQWQEGARTEQVELKTKLQDVR